MIQGRIDKAGLVRVPITLVALSGEEVEAFLDTGFNGALILSRVYEDLLDSTYVGEIQSELANGQIVTDALFQVTVRFDNEMKKVLVSFADSQDNLVGTRLLRGKQVFINFVSGEVIISSAP